MANQEPAILDVIVKIMGVFGFFLGLGSAGWNVWTYYDRKREKANACAAFEGSVRFSEPALLLTVWNPGQIPLYLKEVALKWGEMATEVAMPLRPLSKQEALQPGQSSEYVLLAGSLRLLRGRPLATMSNLRIEVRTAARAVCVLDKKIVAPFVDMLSRPEDVAPPAVTAAGQTSQASLKEAP